MSPILVRPVREQLEHDRVIRLLQAKYKRRFEVAINPGQEQSTPVGPPQSPWYPDLVLLSPERGKKLLGVVEVETAESVNHLEAMSQWAAFAKLKVEFHLYVPISGVDSARRLCGDLQIPTTEIWAYTALGDQIRFTAVQRAPGAAPDGRPKAASEPKPAREPQPVRAAKGASPPGRPKPPARRAAHAPKARSAKARTATVRRPPAKAAARKNASSKAQKRK